MNKARTNHYPEGTFGSDVEENAGIIAEFLIREKPGYKVGKGITDQEIFIDAAFPREAVLAFGCDFFQTYDMHDVLDMPNPSKKTQSRTSDDNIKENAAYRDRRNRLVRDGGFTHINNDEIARAEEVQEEHPEIAQATHVYNVMVNTYINALKQSLEALPEAKTEDGAFYIAIIKHQIITPASYNEMEDIVLPSLALSNGITEGKQDLVGKDLTNGIITHLQGDLSGFESYRDARGINQCPYQNASGGFSVLWNTFFEPQTDGTYTPQSMVGGFFNSVMGALYPDRYPQFANPQQDASETLGIT